MFQGRGVDIRMWLRKGQMARFCEYGTVQKYKNNQQMHFSIYDVFYS